MDGVVEGARLIGRKERGEGRKKEVGKDKKDKKDEEEMKGMEGVVVRQDER